ncbi:hypothetical protein [Devosia sp. FKR38]|uniref:hypothetical protein n=1 Tax=Devosia sp. FKR38 TaxID=2562312 RepID=UPI0010BFFA44|nr:hypothetical protein [Devosia sp. FKR38]
MPFRSRGIAREFGAAIAVLAIYVLTLLAPLHQAAGLQRDLAQLGYQSQATWPVCQALASDESGNRLPGTVQCAVAGIANNQVIPVLAAVTPVAILRASDPVTYASLFAPHPGPVAQHSAQPRAPPVTV